MTILPGIILPVGGLLLLLGDSPLLGLVLVALGSVSLVMSVRRVRANLSPPDPGSGLSSAEYDYLVWTMFAVPMIFVLLLLVMLVTGGLRPT